MQLQTEFVVQAPIDQVWNFLLDVHRVAPCMPGAELTEVVDERTWKGKTNIKVGPVALSFAGTVVMEERDDVAHRVVLKAQGMEQRGKGAASAVASSRLEEVSDGTKVTLDTDLTITGAVAQYGRGMIADVSERLTREFARCLEAGITAQAASLQVTPHVSAHEPPAGPATREPPGTAPVRAAAPVKGIRLSLWALWRAIVRFLRRLVGRR